MLVLATAAAIHVGHAQRTAAITDVGLTELPSSAWQPLFPQAGQLIPDADNTGRVRLDQSDGTTLGYLVQTSPAGDEAIGFSGPSNVLIALDVDGQISRVRIANSGDTVEHVAAVNSSKTFATGWTGLTLREAARHTIDAVSGATLTSTAANKAVMLRCGGEAVSLRFPDPITLEQVQRIFPAAQSPRQLTTEEQTEVLGSEGVLGYVIRPSRQGITPVRYHGPTDILIGIDRDLNIAGLAFLKSFDDPQYYGYIAEDQWFPQSLNGRSFPEFHEVDLYDARVEGVSGATITSLKIAEMVQMASEKFDGIRRDQAVVERAQFESTSDAVLWAAGLVVPIICIGGGAILPFLKGRRRFAVIWPIIILLGLGLYRGDLLSQAMLVGWARHGISTVGGYGLIALAAVAFFFPVVGGRNVYCSHLCAHGAAQMLVRNRVPKRWKLPKWLLRPMKFLPAILMTTMVIVASGGFALSLVNLEAFDAYLWPVCGWIPVTIALVGLAVSAIEPMAYCRFACPTGSLLNYVRRHRQSDRWTRVDWFATLLVAIAWTLTF